MALKPADEWQREFWERCGAAFWKAGGATRVECEIIRDIQRDALEAAEEFLRQHGMCMQLRQLVPPDVGE
jgi:hypothetical protein